MTNEKFMREAPVRKLICRMGLPVIAVILMQLLYNMADIFFMGRSGPAVQVAAITLAGPLFSVISAFNVLLGFGGCTAISMALGRGDDRKVRQYSAFVLYGSLIAGVFAGAFALIGSQQLLDLLGAAGEVRTYTADYVRIIAAGAPFSIASGALGNSIRADGDSRPALVSSMLGIAVNLALDPLFISVLGWGIRGAAAATVAGNLVSFAALIPASRKKENFSVSVRDFTLNREISLKTLGFGLPLAAGSLLMTFSASFCNHVTMKYGEAVVAAQGIAGKGSMIVVMAAMAICIGVQPAISFNYGKGDVRRVRRIICGTTAFVTCLCAVLALGLWLIRESFISLFIGDSEIVSVGASMLGVSLLAAPAWGICQAVGTYLQATDRTAQATLASLLRQGIILIPAVHLLNRAFGLRGLIFSGTAADVISAVLTAAIALHGARQEKHGGALGSERKGSPFGRLCGHKSAACPAVSAARSRQQV